MWGKGKLKKSLCNLLIVLVLVAIAVLGALKLMDWLSTTGILTFAVIGIVAVAALLVDVCIWLIGELR